jgi:DNA polymerase lambda
MSFAKPVIAASKRKLVSEEIYESVNENLKRAIGILVASETEEEIFRILGVPWQEPHERVRG